MRAHSDMHSFSNINSRSLTMSCLSTREANTCLLDTTQLYVLPKIHTHTFTKYPQQLVFTYRVNNQPQQQPTTALQCFVSNTALK